MDKLILFVEPDKTAVLLKFLRTIKYVKVEKEKKIIIPKWHKKILKERIKHIKEHPEAVVDSKTFTRKIRRHLKKNGGR